MRNVAIGITVFLVLITGVWYFTQSNKKVQTVPETTTPEASIPVVPTTSTVAKEIEVIAKNYTFSPTEIRVKKGDKVKLIFKNEVGNHDFVLPDFNVQTEILTSGKEETIEFTADKTGTFEYFCSVGNHRAMGMKGNLIVE